MALELSSAYEQVRNPGEWPGKRQGSSGRHGIDGPEVNDMLRPTLPTIVFGALVLLGFALLVTVFLPLSGPACGARRATACILLLFERIYLHLRVGRRELVGGRRSERDASSARTDGPRYGGRAASATWLPGLARRLLALGGVLFNFIRR